MDPADPALGSVWMDEDITERRRAEEELQRVLAEQQALTNNVVVGISFVREGRTVRCNRRFEEMFGFEPGEALGASARQSYFTDEDFESMQAACEDLNAGRTSTTERWLRRKDGSGFWCRMSGRALEPGQPDKGNVWLFEDITEQKRAAGEIQRLAEEQRLILDNATVGIAFVRDHVVQRCNRYLEEMVGAAPGGLIGQTVVGAVRGPARVEGDRRGGAYSRTEPGEHVRPRMPASGAPTAAPSLCRTRGRRIDAGGAEQEWIWSFEDVTVEREAEERDAPRARRAGADPRPTPRSASRSRASASCSAATRASSRCSATRPAS